jgi:Rrf2 family transcriptional regulator, iron-sulfur cluster assembly transcription factor
MLITRASEYALLSLVILAKSSSPVDSQALSKELSISKSFLSKILQALTKADILHSLRGANGGFFLAKNSTDITVLEVMQAVETKGPSVLDCASSKQMCGPGQAQGCSLWPFLYKLQNQINTFLNTLTIDDLVKES